MFAKLLKHEWKANAGLLGILSLAVLGVSLLVTALLRFATAEVENVPDAVWAPVWFLIVGGFLSMVAYAVAVQIILLLRFYKHKFSNEGYLTFTLPVGAHQILLSSLVNFMIWSVISAVVVFVGFALPITVGTTQKGLINHELLKILNEMWQLVEMIPNEELGYFVLTVVSTLVQALASVMLCHTAIAMGAVLAKKHKVLAAFGCYYGINMGLGIITSAMSVGLSVANVFMVAEPDVFGALNGVVIAQMLVYVVVAVAGYCVSHYLMKYKLNLP